jgi:hypothetical protein
MLAFFTGITATVVIGAAAATTTTATSVFVAEKRQPAAQQKNHCGYHAYPDNHFLPHDSPLAICVISFCRMAYSVNGYSNKLASV